MRGRRLEHPELEATVAVRYLAQSGLLDLVIRWVVVVALAVLTAHVTPANAEPSDTGVRADASRRTGPISIDGHLDEATWAVASRQGGFIQRYPVDQVPATMPTEFAILFDDDAVYIGVWATDPEPQKIRRLLTRRDTDSSSDTISIAFDSFHDHRTAYGFTIGAGGVQHDYLIFDDSSFDDTWDSVWTAEAAQTETGWTAEVRIPFNQLRFPRSAVHEWGFQIIRTVGRTREQSAWSPWPRSAAGVVSKFGVLDGITDVQPGRRLELLPYLTAGLTLLRGQPGDPLHEDVARRGTVGLDARYGLGPAFTLSATINPDFGQVEADPSQVNLSANELFFAEKRPFFLEGVDLFKLRLGVGSNNSEGAFYSRRIAAAPPGEITAYKYASLPTSTQIYGAAKLTGKTIGGWSVGLLDAVTGQEHATVIAADDTRTTPLVAPLTNYAMARVKRDFRDGRTSLGGAVTAVDRAVAGTPLEAVLRDQAYTGGLQLAHRWADNAWTADVNTISSWVHGSTDAITLTQKLSRHLYQRPDATEVALDPTRRSLTGHGISATIGRLGETEHVRYGLGIDVRTPGLELNDLGFQQFSDRALGFLYGEYRDDAPGERALNWKINGDFYGVSSLEPLVTDAGFECNGTVQLVSHWVLSVGCNLDRAYWDIQALRGGRALRKDPNVRGFVSISTDDRKAVQLSGTLSANRDWRADEIDGGVELGATLQARANVDLFIGPTWSFRRDGMQYVSEVNDTEGQPHFLFDRIDQTTAAMTVRLNWTFSPRLSLQAYVQPFLASGRYSQLKDVDDPHARSFADRFQLIGVGEQATVDNTVYVTHGGQSYSFGRPDFNRRELRSTIVLRWEYRPGSTVFAIWSHGQMSQETSGEFRFRHDVGELVSAAGENIFMVKANYWIGL